MNKAGLEHFLFYILVVLIYNKESERLTFRFFIIIVISIKTFKLKNMYILYKITINNKIRINIKI